jgi:hypothetical protein
LVHDTVLRAPGARAAAGERIMVTADSVQGDNAKRLLAYWDACRGSRRFPARSDIDPADFSFALGSVSLIECTGRPPRFRYRVVSTGLTRQLGYEMTGRFTDEIPEPNVRAYVEQLYAAICTEGEPRYEIGETVIDGRQWSYEMLALPLSRDGAQTDMLLVYREASVRPASD